MIIYIELIEEDKFTDYLFIKIRNDQFEMNNMPSSNTQRVK